MTTPKLYYKYLENKIFPVEIIYQALFSSSCRDTNCWKRRHRTHHDFFEYDESYKDREEKYGVEKEILSEVLEQHGAIEGYQSYKHKTPFTGIQALMAHQFVMKILAVICKGEFSILLDGNTA